MELIKKRGTYAIVCCF